MEAKLASIDVNQEAMAIQQQEMNDRMKVMDVRQDIMGADLKAVLELLNKP